MREKNLCKLFFKHSPVGFSYNRIIYDDNENPKDYEIVEVNKSYESMVGLEEKDLIGKRISQLYEAIKNDQPSWENLHRSIEENGKENDFEFYYNPLDKHYRIKSYCPEEGYLILYLTDISAEARKKEELNMLSDNVSTQLWYLNDINTYGYANKAHADFVGFEKKDLALKNVNDLFSEEQAKMCVEGNKKVFRQKEEISLKSWQYNYHGEKRLLSITKKPKFNLKGEIEFVICSAEDITEEYFSKEQKTIKERILYSTIDFTQELLTNDNHYDALSKGIEMLGNATQVDRVYYWENHFDKDSKKWVTSQRFEWCLGDIEQQIDNPELQNIPFDEVGDFIGTLSQNKIFKTHIKDMNDKSSSTKQILEDQGILSILVIPVFAKDEFRGFIGFDSCKLEKEWSQVEISLLNSFVLLYVKAIEKNLLKKNIIQVKENFNNFFNMIQDLLFVLDFEGKIVDINDTVLDRFKYSRKELLGNSVLMLHPEDKRKEAQKNIEDLIAKKSEYCNIPAITKDGERFPVETRVSEGVWNGKEVIFAVSKDISELSMSEEKFSKAWMGYTK